MALARFHLHAQGVEIWVAPTLARGDGWIADAPTLGTGHYLTCFPA